MLRFAVVHNPARDALTMPRVGRKQGIVEIDDSQIFFSDDVSGEEKIVVDAQYHGWIIQPVQESRSFIAANFPKKDVVPGA
jgi:hypothetical protein